MTYSLIDFVVEAGIATITFNRPDKRNAFSDTMRSEFIHALEQVSADRAIRALVITGAGKGFCAGGDIAGMEKRMSAPTGEIGFNGWHRQQRVHHTQSLLHNMPKPTIAAVNGAASGLGADTALACDFIIESEYASFTWSYINRGIIPDGGEVFAPASRELVDGKAIDLFGAQGRCRRSAGPWDRGSQGFLGNAGGRCASLGSRTQQGIGHGAGARKINHQSDLRILGAPGVRARQSGTGHLLHEQRAPRLGAGLSRHNAKKV